MAISAKTARSRAFEVLDIPYAECGVLPSAVGMDKVITKYVLRSAGIPVIDWYSFYGHDWLTDETRLIEEMEEQIGYPLIVKPATGGSSIGISIVHNRQELKDGVELARSMAEKLLWKNWCRILGGQLFGAWRQ